DLPHRLRAFVCCGFAEIYRPAQAGAAARPWRSGDCRPLRHLRLLGPRRLLPAVRGDDAPIRQPVRRHSGPGQPHSLECALEAQPRERITALAAHPRQRLSVSAGALAVSAPDGTVSGRASQSLRSRLPDQNVVRPGTELWRADTGLDWVAAAERRGD